jgi:hypothetical protein
MERRGNRQTTRETEKERVRVWEHCGKMNSASVIKLTVGKNPVISFGDKPGRINNFWETILIVKGDRKDT